MVQIHPPLNHNGACSVTASTRGCDPRRRSSSLRLCPQISDGSTIGRCTRLKSVIGASSSLVRRIMFTQILCKIGIHNWQYPVHRLNHRYCEWCEKEQEYWIFDRWKDVK